MNTVLYVIHFAKYIKLYYNTLIYTLLFIYANVIYKFLIIKIFSIVKNGHYII